MSLKYSIPLLLSLLAIITSCEDSAIYNAIIVNKQDTLAKLNEIYSNLRLNSYHNENSYNHATIKNEINSFHNLGIEYHKFGNYKGTAACLNQVARLYSQNGLHDLAVQYYKEALEIYVDIDSVNYCKLVMDNLLANRVHNNYDDPIKADISSLLHKYDLNNNLYYQYVLKLDNGQFNDIYLDKLSPDNRKTILSILIDAYQISGDYQESNRYVDMYLNTSLNSDKLIRAQYFYGYNHKMLGEEYVHYFQNVFNSRKLLNDNKAYHFDSGVELLEFQYDSLLALELASLKFNLRMSANIIKFDSIIKANNNSNAIALFAENKSNFDNLTASLKDIVINHERSKRIEEKEILNKTLYLTFGIFILLTLSASVIIVVLYNRVIQSNPVEMQAHIDKLEEAVRLNHKLIKNNYDTISELSNYLQDSLGENIELKRIIEDHKRFNKISAELKHNEIIQYQELVNHIIVILEKIGSATYDPKTKKRVSDAIFTITRTMDKNNSSIHLN